MKSLFRKLHRWIGLALALQILAWMLSGFYFTLFPIETIRGEHLTQESETLAEVALEHMISPQSAWDGLLEASLGEIELLEMSFLRRFNLDWYRITVNLDGQVYTRLVNASDGTLMPPMSREVALQRAQALLLGSQTPLAMEWVTSQHPGGEYRGSVLPVWRAVYEEPESLSLYLDPYTGDLLARRTDRWRIFDFLWMLHIMDYETRSDFNTRLLMVASSLGFFVAFSGLVYWAMSSRLLRRRRRV